MIIPLGNYVLVIPAKVENKTKSGILLDAVSETTKRGNFSTGTVVKISPEINPTPFIKENDTVKYITGTGILFDYENKDYLLLRISEIYMVEK